MPELTPGTILPLADQQSKTLAEACLDSSRPLRKARDRAFWWITRVPFYLAVCLRRPEEEPRLFWLSKGEDPSLFADHGVVGPWTPVGRVALEVKNAIKDRRPLKPITVHVPAWAGGPLLPVEWIPCGSVADVTLTYGGTHAIVIEATVWDAATGESNRVTPSQAARRGIETADILPAPGYGLTDVIGSLDVEQLRNVDFPDDGQLIVTGCAGTGKTTVAMYRASYLLAQQREALRENRDAPIFFRKPEFLVLVRQEHLRPYLEDLADAIGLPGLPVDSFDEWFQREVFRPFFKHSDTRFTFDPDSMLVEWVKHFDETHIDAFLSRETPTFWGDNLSAAGQVATTAIARIEKWIVPALLSMDRRDTIEAERRQWVGRLRKLTRPQWTRVSEVSKYFSSVSSVFQKIRHDIDDVVDLLRWHQAHGPEVLELQRELERVEARVMNRATRLDSLLRLFYSSNVAGRVLALNFGASSVAEATATLANPKRPFNRADQAVMLWLADRFLENLPATTSHGLRSIRQYDHLIVDEAQYYSAGLLRFFSRRCRSPRRAITIVGDLDQRFHSGPAAFDWRDVVGHENSRRIKRLDRLYRCSREIYEFLFAFSRVLGVAAYLVAPREVDRFSSARPQAAVFDDDVEELKWIVRQIDALKATEAALSVAVIIDRREKLSEQSLTITRMLSELGIPARVAYGEDIRESSKKVMITDSESVIGLEFDCVFLPRFVSTWGEGRLSADHARELWVCATRAKRFLMFTSVGHFPSWLAGLTIGEVGFP